MDGKRTLSWLRREAGYNLIEVLIAVALLATVLVAIISLFVLGGRYVKSGKELSKATALGMDAMEEVRNMAFQQVFRVINAGCSGTCETTRTWRSHAGDAGVDYGVPDATDWQGRDIPDSGWSWKTENDGGSEDYEKILVGWYDQTDRQFPAGLEGATEIRVDGFADLAPSDWADGDTCLCDARYIRVRVKVEWREGRRERDVTFETLKF